MDKANIDKTMYMTNMKTNKNLDMNIIVTHV